MITKCPHGMPSPKSCVECMYDDGVVEPEVDPIIEVSFRAQHRGTCPDCGGYIEEGHLIRLARDQRYYHVNCDDPEEG